MAYIGSPAAPTVATVSDGTVTSAKLDTNIAVDGNLTVDTNTLYVDSSNNSVNIGTTGVTIDASAGLFAGITPKQVIQTGSASNSYQRLILIQNPSAESGSETLARVGIKLGVGGESNTGNSNKSAVVYAESTSAYNNGTSLCFATSNTERMRIDSSGNLLFNSGYGSAATAYGCRAWVNFNGTGTVAIRASGNVSSITDNGTGDYTVNFTNAMTDANYSAVITSGYHTVSWGLIYFNAAFTTSACRFITTSPSEVDIDNQIVCASFFR